VARPEAVIIDGHPIMDAMGTDLTIRSTDGRSILVEFGPYALDLRDARDLAYALQVAVGAAEAAETVHERHANLMARCVLCRYEAGTQLDRLTNDEDDGRTLDAYDPSSNLDPSARV